jgi:polysaccharide export outer membrane protein
MEFFVTRTSLWLAFVPLLVLGFAPARADVRSDTTGMDWSRVPEYRIVPGDLLKLNFGPRETDLTDLVRELRVRPDGRVSVYPIGDVVAAGHSPRELEASLVGLLSAELKNPRVTVEVAEVAGNQIHVLGRVTNPGSYPAGPFTTVIQAITRAGGFSDDAARNSVVVFHRDGGRTVAVARIRVDEALKRGRIDADYPLSRFDIVYVPRSTIGNINVFARQFFAEQGPILSTTILGWELFHMDRLYVIR